MLGLPLLLLHPAVHYVQLELELGALPANQVSPKQNTELI